MHCKQAEQLLSQSLDRELESSRERELKGHLQSCPTCEDLRKNWKELGDVLRASPLPSPPDVAEVCSEIERDLPGSNPTSLRFRLKQELLLAGAAAALLIVSLFIYLGFSRQGDPSPVMVQAAEVEFLETGIPGATPVVFVDSVTGMTVLWVVEEDTSDSREI